MDILGGRPLVDHLALCWAEILEAPAVTADNNFFVLGGDSLRAVMLMARIEEDFQILLDPVEVYDAPVLADFADLLAMNLPASTLPGVEEGVI